MNRKLFGYRFWLVVTGQLALLLGTGGPCLADTLTLDGYNSAAVGVYSYAQLHGLASFKLGGLDEFAAFGASGMALPAQNKSIMFAEAPDFLTRAHASANVHYMLKNKTTGRLDTLGGVSIHFVGAASIRPPGGNASWFLAIDPSNPPPILSVTTDTDGTIVSAFVSGSYVNDFLNADAFATGSTDGFFGSTTYQDDLSSGRVVGKGPNLATTLLVLGSEFNVDEAVSANNGLAVIDPVLTPLNPNDILVSDATINPNPNAPIFTDSQVAALTAQGVDLSFLRSRGLIGGAPAPEPGTLAMFGTGILGVAGALRRKYQVSQGKSRGSRRS